jgi:hypothetical protein
MIRLGRAESADPVSLAMLMLLENLSPRRGPGGSA